MSDEKDRLGDKLHDAEMARENQWARQRDAEIIERLRRKYVKAINCPQCGDRLDARVAIGVGGMACPSHHGAWADGEALEQLRARMDNAADIYHESLGEKVFVGLGEIVEDLRHRHLREIDCPTCGARLNARAAITPGVAGLAGMACPNRHGAWVDQDMLREIRKRLDTAAGTHSSGETRK
jgi:Zn-finger nucleic acid-binding protein